MMKTTHKKEMYARHEELIDDQGNVIEQDKILINEFIPSQNFWKCYLSYFLTAIGLVAESKAIDIIEFIGRNVNPSSNLFIGSLKTITQKMQEQGNEISFATVQRVFAKLKGIKDSKGLPMIKEVVRGVYMLNPNLICKGNEFHRQILINLYASDNIEESQLQIDVLKKKEKELEEAEKQKLLDTIAETKGR